MSEDERPLSYTFIEVRTLNGQLVQLLADSERKEEIQQILQKGVLEVYDDSHEGCTSVQMGSYIRYSRYAIKQHKYVGGGHPGNGSIKEILEIRNPPDDRCPFVLHASWENPASPEAHFFIEFDSLEQAISAFDKQYRFKRDEAEKAAQSLPGFKRFVYCGFLTPWFYAVGNQELLGDFVIIPGWGNNPMYPVGRQFIVETEGGSRAKFCMGARIFTNPKGIASHYVLWHDGTCWNGAGKPPKLSKVQPVSSPSGSTK